MLERTRFWYAANVGDESGVQSSILGMGADAIETRASAAAYSSDDGATTRGEPYWHEHRVVTDEVAILQ